MSKIALYISLITIFVVLSSAAEDSSCDVRVLKNELIQELKPDFKYDSSNINRFNLEAEKQGTEFQVPIFSGESYKLLFNTSGIPTDFEIKIFDKKVGSNNRKLLFYVNGSKTNTKKVFVFEPENSRTVYIDYFLPGVEDKNLTACVVFLMGYKIG